jgi:hypothetical protein
MEAKQASVWADVGRRWWDRQPGRGQWATRWPCFDCLTGLHAAGWADWGRRLERARELSYVRERGAK